MSTAETGQVTGTKDKTYNIIWFTEACLDNVLRLEQYIQDAERDNDSELADFFRRAQAESRKGGEQGKQLLRARLGNVLGSWEEPVVIDWPNALRGDPLADVARTDLLHRVATPVAGTPLAAVLIPLGRGLLTRRYLAEYDRLRPLDRDRLDRWRVVCAAARFGEGIEEEFPRLTRLLESAR